MSAVVGDAAAPDAVVCVLHGARAPPRPPPPGQFLLLRSVRARLAIRLINLNKANSGIEVNFDDVTLDAAPAP